MIPDTTKISIIVPVYRVEEYLSQCVEPILDQTYQNIELILVDDGSPDRCGSMCDAYAEKDKRVQVIHQINQGLSGARNTGFSYATGEFIVFIDSDDIVSRNYISHLMELHRKTGSLECICRVADFQDGRQPHFTDGGNMVVLTKEDALTDFLYMNRIRTGVIGKLLHRSLCENNLFQTGIYYEDAEPMYRALCRTETVALSDAVLFGYRYRLSSQSKQRFSTREMSCIDVWERIYQDVTESYPSLSIVAANRFLSACAHIFFMIPEGEYPQETKRIWNHIKAQRKAILSDRNARKKARMMALLSYSGKRITKILGKRLLKRENKRKFMETV